DVADRAVLGGHPLPVRGPHARGFCLRPPGRRDHRHVLHDLRGRGHRGRLGAVRGGPRPTWRPAPASRKKRWHNPDRPCTITCLTRGIRTLTHVQTLIEEIPKYQPGADLDLLTRAYRFSEASHQGQQRASGEPYLSHPLEVAHLLVDFK